MEVLNMDNVLLEAEIDKIRVVDGFNPRKGFDQAKMAELQASIAAKGVLQPILLRPKGKELILVSGERRLRAAKAAGLEKIPALVRQLTEEQAFEMAIIENLQRDDVHPLDEAQGFSKMLASERYTIENIAEIMARTTSYITRRLKLVDLIDEVRKAFYDGTINIGHAMELSRLQSDDQKSICERLLGSVNAWQNGHRSVTWLREHIESEYLRKLSAGKFKTTDPDLLPEAGPCNTCPKRSGANPDLFGDIKKEDICFDAACFQKKSDLAFNNKIEDVIAQGKLILGIDYGKPPEEALLKRLKKEGVRVYKEGKDYWSTTSKRGGNIVGCFVINGWDRGDVINVKLEKAATSAHSQEPGTDPAQSEADEIRAEIERRQSREDRAVELDREKVMAHVEQELATHTARVKSNKAAELPCKTMLFLAALLALDHHMPKEIEDELTRHAAKPSKGEKEIWGYTAKRLAWAELFCGTKNLMNPSIVSLANRVIAAALVSRYRSASDLDPDKSLAPRAMKELAINIIPKYYREREAEQVEIKTARQIKLDTKMNDLRVRLFDTKKSKS